MVIFLNTYLNKFNKAPLGLGNWLKVLFSTYRLNKIYNNREDLPNVDMELESEFNSLFTNKNFIYPQLLETKDWYMIEGNKLICPKKNHPSPLLSDNPRGIIKLCGWRLFISEDDNVNTEPFGEEWINRDDSNSVDFRFNNIPENVKKTYLSVIDKFTIHDSINNWVKSQIESISGDYLGVHIRTWKTNIWDHEGLPARSHFENSKHKFTQSINNSPIDKIFISTDNISEIQEILNNLEGKEVYLYESNSNFNRIQNDFCEMLILSRSKHLIGSCMSTYSEIAWWYSKCNPNVEII